MDCCASSYKRIPVIDALPTAVKSSDKGGRDRKLFFASTLGFSDSSSSTSKSTLLSQRVLKVSSALGRGGNRRRAQSFIVAAAAAAANEADSNPCNFSGVGTPLEPRSSAGTFLSSILQNQRHLFQYAVAEQLDELAADRYGAVVRNNQSLGSSESCLHRRIAEMKENECQIAVEDVMYMSIVHKFSEIKVPMVPKLLGCNINGRLEIWPSKDIELESVHSLEVQEMIKEHLSTILSWRVRSTTDNGNTNQIPRLQLGRIYAASIMYGYFLRSACLRHNLESSLSLTHGDFHSLGYGTRNPIADFFPHGSNDNDFVGQSTNTRSTSLCQESRGGKAEKLKNYILGFDSETLQRCSKLKSKEAVNLIEKHTWALFGDENSGNAELNEVMNLTNSSMKRLVLEATAFGSFLWDVEEYVDSVYRLKEN